MHASSAALFELRAEGRWETGPVVFVVTFFFSFFFLFFSLSALGQEGPGT